MLGSPPRLSTQYPVTFDLHGLVEQYGNRSLQSLHAVFNYRFQHLPDCRILLVVGHFRSSIFGFSEPLEY